MSALVALAFFNILTVSDETGDFRTKCNPHTAGILAAIMFALAFAFQWAFSGWLNRQDGSR